MEFDFTKTYRLDGDKYAVAYRATGYAQKWEPMQIFMECEDEYCDCHTDDDKMHLADDPNGEGEWIDSPEDGITCHMVGDDRDFIYPAEDFIPIEDEEYCGECGQIGCGWG